MLKTTREEAAVLRLVLELHPTALTLDELNREITGGLVFRQLALAFGLEPCSGHRCQKQP